MSGIPERLSYDVFGRTVTVKLGEFVLPIIAIGACALYYIDTRGLPEQSLMYAEPVLYVTTALAVITIVQHGVVFGEDEEVMTDGGETDEAGENDDLVADGAGGVDVADGVTDRTSEREMLDDQDTETSSPHFGRKASVMFVVLTTGYVVALNTLFMTSVVFMGLSAAFLAATLVLFGERSWLKVAAYSVGFSVAVWAVFVYWLKIPLS